MTEVEFYRQINEVPLTLRDWQSSALYQMFVSGQSDCLKLPRQAGKTTMGIVASSFGALLVVDKVSWRDRIRRELIPRCGIGRKENIVSLADFGSPSRLSGLPRNYIVFDECNKVRGVGVNRTVTLELETRKCVRGGPECIGCSPDCLEDSERYLEELRILSRSW